MRLKFLDKVDNMSSGQFLIGLSVFQIGFFGFAKLMQILLNSLNILHVDYWMSFIVLYMLMVLIYIVILNIRIIKTDRNKLNERKYE